MTDNNNKPTCPCGSVLAITHADVEGRVMITNRCTVRCSECALEVAGYIPLNEEELEIMVLKYAVAYWQKKSESERLHYLEYRDKVEKYCAELIGAGIK